jgi:septum formation protein
LFSVAETPATTLSRPLILASGSRYRRDLLARLGLPFEVASPDVDESRLPGEPAAALAERLALAKAKAIAERHPKALVIGSDQVCALGEDCLGKPGSPQGQKAMLERLSGHTVVYHTAVAVVGLEAGLWQRHRDETRCVFRALTLIEIDDYVRREPAADCAGGFKSEGLGISLFERMESLDPTAIIGLPMIFVAQALRPYVVASTR